MTDWILVIFGLGLVISAIYLEQIQRSRVEAQLIKLIEQTGGSKITVHYQRRFGVRGVMYFEVNFVDVNGVKQRRQVSRRMGFWSEPQGDFYWDKPLTAQTVQNPSQSKEQIISNMDAEIKRLQKELEQARREPRSG